MCLCYKQKCKVVSLNLAHPVHANELSADGQYKMYDFETFAFEKYHDLETRV